VTLSGEQEDAGVEEREPGLNIYVLEMALKAP
jgi:hypothetical protein